MNSFKLEQYIYEIIAELQKIVTICLLILLDSKLDSTILFTYLLTTPTDTYAPLCHCQVEHLQSWPFGISLQPPWVHAENF